MIEKDQINEEKNSISKSKNEEKNSQIKEKSIKKSFIEEEEFLRNLEEKKKEFLLNQEYHSDDIERGEFKNIIYNKEKETQNSEIIYDNPDDIKYKRIIMYKRLFIEFTLINLLISIIFLFGYFFFIKRSLLDIMIVLRSKTMHFQSYFFCVYGIWLIISCN
jgi:hypothetical protein